MERVSIEVFGTINQDDVEGISEDSLTPSYEENKGFETPIEPSDMTGRGVLDFIQRGWESRRLTTLNKSEEVTPTRAR